MPRQVVDLNTDHITYVGDDLKTAFTKTNANFVEVYATAEDHESRIDTLEAATGGGALVDVIAGTNISIDKTDPLRPVISSTGGGGGGSGIPMTGGTIANTATGTSGVKNTFKYITAVEPGAASSAVFSIENKELTYNQAYTLGVGGWLNADQATVSLGSAAGAVDKVVAHMSQLNIVNQQPVGAALCYEAAISAIGPNTNVSGGAIGFFFPNLRNVPNINRLNDKLACFMNQDKEARFQTAGKIINGTLEELAPPYHPGLRSGRYYTAPFRYAGINWMQPNIATAMPIYIPHRCTMADIGVYAKANTDKTRRIIFGLYTAENGRIQNRVWQSPAALTAPDTDSYISQNVNIELDAGTYWIVAISNVNFACMHHSASGHDLRAHWYGQTDPAATDSALFRTAYFQPGAMTVGMFPLSAQVHPEYGASDAEPHIMFRVS